MAASSPSAQDTPGPQGNLQAPSSSAAVSSRRLPPPCWSHDETVALIDAYREKWYSLRRGNLRANHWQEVAEAVAARCPISNPKTAVQCRHKMEKLRKRYRAELQRGLSTPNGHKYCFSWVHFNRMDAMEKGPNATATAITTLTAVPINMGPSDRYVDDDEPGEDPNVALEELYQNTVRQALPYTNRSFHGPISNGIGGGRGGGGGFQIRIPSRAGPQKEARGAHSKVDEMIDQTRHPDYGSGKVLKDRYAGRSGPGNPKYGGGGGGERKRKEEVEVDGVGELVGAIKSLGEGFVRMERMKMEMAREVEEMRMEMEVKRTEMILESQLRIVEAFAEALSGKKSPKKPKRMPSP